MEDVLGFGARRSKCHGLCTGFIQEPPSNAAAATKTKYRKGEIKAKMIIWDSIHKHLVAYISELKTSKEMYDKLVSMFRASNANQILFFKN